VETDHIPIVGGQWQWVHHASPRSAELVRKQMWPGSRHLRLRYVSDTPCVHCGTVGLVRAESGVAGDQSVLDYHCDACKSVWRVPQPKERRDGTLERRTGLVERRRVVRQDRRERNVARWGLRRLSSWPVPRSGLELFVWPRTVTNPWSSAVRVVANHRNVVNAVARPTP